MRFGKSSISLSDSFGDALIGPCQKEDIDQAGKNEDSRPSTRGFITQSYIGSQGGDLFRSQTRHHSTQFFHDPLSLTALNHRRGGFETRIIPHLDRRLYLLKLSIHQVRDYLKLTRGDADWPRTLELVD